MNQSSKLNQVHFAYILSVLVRQILSGKWSIFCLADFWSNTFWSSRTDTRTGESAMCWALKQKMGEHATNANEAEAKAEALTF